MKCLEEETTAILDRFGGTRNKHRRSTKAKRNINRQYSTPSIEYHGDNNAPSQHVVKKCVQQESSPDLERHNDGSILHGERKRLFGEDGMADVHLSETIANALKSSRFDSVPAILASSGGMIHSTLYSGTENCIDNPKLKYKHQYLFTDEKKQKMVSRLTSKVLHATVEDSNLSALQNASSSNIRSNMEVLALRDINYAGFEKPLSVEEKATVGMQHRDNDTKNMMKKQSKHLEVCFNCWSARKGEHCTLHDVSIRDSGENNSVILCKNWDIDMIRQRYRCEYDQVQPISRNSSLRYVKDSRRRSTVTECCSHPLFASLSDHVIQVNFRARRRFHIRQWCRSFIDIVKTNGVHGKDYRLLAKKLMRKVSSFNMKLVQNHSNAIRHLLPSAPVTGTTLAERNGTLQILFTKEITVNNGVIKKNLIIPGPPPSNVSLYKSRVYDRSDPITARLATPEKDEQNSSTPSSRSAKFVTYGRKHNENNKAVGGLSAEIILSELVTKVIPPLYRNFQVVDKIIVVPEIFPEISITVETKPINADKQIYVERDLQHSLDSCRVPTIMVKTGIGPNDRHYFGLNRSKQTGEEGDQGFRTSEYAVPPIIDSTIDSSTFVPAEMIASPNVPKELPPITTSADLSYPFCHIESRKNMIKDLAYLLHSIQVCSSNKAQMFTAMSIQEPGGFMRSCDATQPLGRLQTLTTRSWTFLQKRRIEKFVTAKGMPYWYDRQTGQTFWEKPLCQEETIPVKEGGIFLGSRSCDVCDKVIRDAMDSDAAYRSNLRKIFIAQHDTENDKKAENPSVCLVNISEDLKVGFIKALSTRRVGRQYVDYTPSVLNLPKSAPVGRVKPRSAGKDWSTIGFDPWSAGKEVLTFQFLPSIPSSKTGLNCRTNDVDNDITLLNTVDLAGFAEQDKVALADDKLKSEFNIISKYVRHGNYNELNDTVNAPDWSVPIDYSDEVGNTLLMICCQNGNRRMVKLCLRIGSDINRQNFNGQTCLHYAFGYGFGEYKTK